MARPATSLDHHADDNAGSVLGKRKGMQLSIFFPPRSYSCPIGPPDSRMHTSSLKGPRSVSTSRMNKNPSPLEAPRMNMHDASPPISHCLPIRGNPSDAGLKDSTSARPGQRSKVPIITPSKPVQPASVSPQTRSKRPPIPLFLSKESTVTDFNRPLDSEWDQEMKEKTMEEIMARVFSRVNQSGQESQGLKEAVEVYKARSEWPGYLHGTSSSNNRL